MKRPTIFLILLCLFASTKAQNIFINYDIDTAVYKVTEPLNLWMDFLKTRDDSAGAKYWNAADVKKYGADSYFLIENELNFGIDNYLKILGYADIMVLSIREVGQYYKITSLMEFEEKDDRSNIQYIFHVYAGRENGNLKLFNALPINTKLYLRSTTVGFIRFHYPRLHLFNYELAKKQSDFLVDLAGHFGVPADTVDYYFAATIEEIQRIKGFDFIIGDNGQQIPTGKADAQNRIVYSAGLGEYYPHEFIHILLNTHYPNCHIWISEGVATYFGMSRGKELDWHLHRLNEHLRTHPEINLDNMLELRTLDQYTDYRYVLGGLIIKMAFEKGGYDLVKELMNGGKTDEDFYAALEKYLGMKQKDLNQEIRRQLEVMYREK